MTDAQWRAFSAFRESFRQKTGEWLLIAQNENLAILQRQAAEEAGVPSYPIETPVVYNGALDAVSPDTEIKLLIAADNPGKEEQSADKRAYLVGHAGKLAAGFFRANPSLGVDFKKNVVILNKTPVHTAKTKQLARLASLGSENVRQLLSAAQIWMARETAKLQRALERPLWIIGYGELKEKGVFADYARALKEFYTQKNAGDNKIDVYVFQHFSMNRFSIDLRAHYDPAATPGQNLAALGLSRRNEILGW